MLKKMGRFLIPYRGQLPAMFILAMRISPLRGAVINPAVDMVQTPREHFLIESKDGAVDARPKNRINLPESFSDRLSVTNVQLARFPRNF
jgi:hypothetical protein